MWQNSNKAESVGLIPQPLRTTIGPLMLMLSTPLTGIIISRAVVDKRGELIATAVEVVQEIVNEGFAKVVLQDAFDPMAWKIIGAYMLTSLVLQRVLPGKCFDGPLSPMGNTPKYKNNGFLHFLVGVVLFVAGAELGFYKGGIAFYHYRELVAAMNIFALFFCLFLYIKGRVLPSSTDSGASGNPVFDYYWGVELYPRVLGWDVKVFTNCRIGMLFWAVGEVSFAYAQLELYGAVSNAMLLCVGLQLIYVGKFFFWEDGYMFTIDIMQDRAGYYICWGCLVWIETLYVSNVSFLVHHPHNFPQPVAITIGVLGIAWILLNYAVDIQRQNFRAAIQRGEKPRIWGKEAEFIVAPYTTADGKTRDSTLLVSGWWGVSRKINFLFELLAAFTWSVTFANPGYMLPYCYFGFLLILLLDRALRDDARCADKYGMKWEAYKKLVPYMLIPGVW
mmetsp:Transcript_61270/g.143379  ORF Transcript_61270/g.143379 Transcript_61270/m.143379 type:complete len:448 (+) Transcript_61270:50-1393(+)